MNTMTEKMQNIDTSHLQDRIVEIILLETWDKFIMVFIKGQRCFCYKFAILC